MSLIAACQGTRQPSNFGPKYWRVPLQSWTPTCLGTTAVVLGKEDDMFVIADPLDPTSQSAYVSPVAGLLVANMLERAASEKAGKHFNYEGYLFEIGTLDAEMAHLSISDASPSTNRRRPPVRIQFPLGPSWSNTVHLRDATRMVLSHFPPREFPQLVDNSLPVVMMGPNMHTPANEGTEPLHPHHHAADIWVSGDNWCGCVGQPASLDTCSPHCHACLARPWYFEAWQEQQRMGGGINGFFLRKDLCGWVGLFAIAEPQNDDGFYEA